MRTELVAVRGDPQVAVVVERHVVRAGDGADALLGEAGEVRRGVVRVARDEEEPPGEPVARRVVPVLRELQDLPVLVGVARVGLVRPGLALLAAVGVVGERHVDPAGARRGLDVLGPVHLGGADLVTGQPRVDVHLVGGHAGHVRGGAGGQRDPDAAAVELAVGGQLAGAVDLGGRGVAGQLRDVQRALVQQRQVVLAGSARGALLHPLAGDELVEVVELLVVSHVDDRAPVRGQPGLGRLVLEPAQRGPLARGGVRVVRVEFDDPAEAVGLVGLLRQVEPPVEPLPLALGGAGADPVPLVHVGVAVGEVLVEVLLAVQRGAPRSRAARAVVEGPEHLAAGAVGGRTQQRASRGRSGDPEFTRGGEPAVERVTADRAQLAGAVLLLDDDHGESVRGPGDLHLLARGVGRIVAAEHEDLVRVLMVGDQYLTAALTAEREEREEVVVVTELARLRLGGLLVRVEGGRPAQDRFAPADHHVLAVPVGDGDLVVLIGRDRREPQAPGAGRGRFTGRFVAVPGKRDGLRLGGVGAGQRGRSGCGGDRHDGGGTHHRAARDGTGDDVARVLVVAGVRGLLEAGVPTAEAAGQRGTPARVGADERQQITHVDSLRRCVVRDARCTPTRSEGLPVNGG
ncbi:hypothetical protein SMICM17S_09235 [Streptomyces microflavus]